MAAKRRKKSSASTVIIVIIVIAVLIAAAVVFAIAYKNEAGNDSNSDDTGVNINEVANTSDDTTTLPIVTTEDTSDEVTTEPEPAEHIEISDLVSNDSADLTNGNKATFSVTAPKLTSDTYGENADKFNEIITTEIEAFKNEFAKAVADGGLPEDASPDLNIEFELTYEVYKSSEGVVSILLKKYIYLAGVHGNTIYKAVNFDLNSAQSVNMQYVVGAPEEEYTPFIKNIILSQMRNDPENPYFSTEDGVLDDTFDDTQFVITETGITVFFQEYDIAPYAAGYQTFEIPYNELIELSSY